MKINNNPFTSSGILPRKNFFLFYVGVLFYSLVLGIAYAIAAFVCEKYGIVLPDPDEVFGGYKYSNPKAFVFFWIPAIYVSTTSYIKRLQDIIQSKLSLLEKIVVLSFNAIPFEFSGALASKSINIFLSFTPLIILLFTPSNSSFFKNLRTKINLPLRNQGIRGSLENL